MIVGIGIDIVEIARMETSLARLGERFAQRILSDAEYTEFQQQQFPARFLAKRFAAKEAAAKALGTGFSQGVSLKHICVSNDELGKPVLSFTQVAADIAREKQIQSFHLSIADEKHYAIANVVLETN